MQGRGSPPLLVEQTRGPASPTRSITILRVYTSSGPTILSQGPRDGIKNLGGEQRLDQEDIHPSLVGDGGKQETS